MLWLKQKIWEMYNLIYELSHPWGGGVHPPTHHPPTHSCKYTHLLISSCTQKHKTYKHTRLPDSPRSNWFPQTCLDPLSGVSALCSQAREPAQMARTLSTFQNYQAFAHKRLPLEMVTSVVFWTLVESLNLRCAVALATNETLSNNYLHDPFIQALWVLLGTFQRLEIAWSCQNVNIRYFPLYEVTVGFISS